MPNNPIAWTPQQGSQTAFLTCSAFECLYGGTRGPGKTDALLMDFAQHVGQGYGAGWRGILFRRTYKQLDDVVTRTKRWFPQIFRDAEYSKGGFAWRFEGGEELLLRHMDNPDDYWNYHGHEYPWVGWEELTNWPDLKCYEAMKSCCRSSYPDMPRKYRATCNPYGVGHNAVKKYFVDPAPFGCPSYDDSGRARVYIHGNIHENRKLLDADPDYMRNLQGITDENRRKAWLFGDWDITAGGALDDVWDRRIHVVRPFKIPASWHCDRSFDWGSAKPFSVGWWAESNGDEAVMADGQRRCFPPGTLFRVGEWYGCSEKQDNVGIQLNSVDIGRGIYKKEQNLQNLYGIRYFGRGPADSSIFDRLDDDSIANKVNTGYREAGGSGDVFVPCNKAAGSRRIGLELIRTRLKAAMEKPMETPGLYVFDTCADWIRTVPVLERSEKDPEDVNTDGEDHAYDETRYRAMHRRGQAVSTGLRL